MAISTIHSKKAAHNTAAGSIPRWSSIKVAINQMIANSMSVSYPHTLHRRQAADGLVVFLLGAELLALFRG